MTNAEEYEKMGKEYFEQNISSKSAWEVLYDIETLRDKPNRYFWTWTYGYDAAQREFVEQHTKEFFVKFDQLCEEYKITINNTYDGYEFTVEIDGEDYKV
jgi:hypothetical protein